MAAALKIPDLMTVDEFLEWDSPGPYLWQLVDGVPVAMSPPAPRHGAIQAQAIRIIGNHLDERDNQCVVVATPGVIPSLQSNRNFRVPDIAVTYFAPDMADKAVREPVLLIEILSPSNHAETWRNVWAYVTIPSLREILVIRSTSAGVELLRRDDDGKWPDRTLTIASGPFSLTSIGLDLTVEALYRGSGLT